MTAEDLLSPGQHPGSEVPAKPGPAQFNLRGAKARDIAELIAVAGQKKLKWKNLTVELAPIAAPDFAKQINKFQTIKIATLNIVRPNLNWNKEKQHADSLADESNGQRVEIGVFAGRGDGLAKNKGIVRLIKALSRERRSNLRNATVTGRRASETSDTTISLERHLEHRNVRVRLGAGGHPETESVERRLIEFLKQRPRRTQNRSD